MPDNAELDMTTAYIISSFRVPKTVLEVFEQIVGDYNQETKHLFAHIYLGHRLKPKKMVPVSRDLIRETWGTLASWKKLNESGLIQVKYFEKFKSLSNEFALTPEVFRLLNDAWPEETKEYIDLEGYNLVNGRRMKPKGHVLSTEKRGKVPSLIRNSMQSIKYCPFNDVAIGEYFQQRWPGGLNNITCEKEKATYYVDRFAFDSMRMSGLQTTSTEGVYIYQPAYKVQYTGRITEVGRGLQSCSRYMKEAAFKDMPNVHNYDLESAQIWVLVQYFEDAGIDTDWLRSYLTTGKEPYFSEAGLDKSTWKNCLISLILGSNCPKTISTSNPDKDYRSSIVDYILEYHDRNLDKAKQSVESFYNLTLNLNKNLKSWYTWLIEVLIKSDNVSYMHKGSHYAKNSTGMLFCISDYLVNGIYRDEAELKRKLAAFFLQGAEASFIHILSFLQDMYDYLVFSNQHDGLVTEGVIPQEAINKAKCVSGLKYAVLIEKSFA